MLEALSQWWSGLPRLTATSVVDIFCVSFLFYQFISLVRGRRSAHILTGIGIIGATYGLAIWAKLELLRTILSTLAPFTAIALIVMFQSELRRGLARIGRRRLQFFSPIERQEVTDEIILALNYFAQHRLGSLIVVEREIGLKSFVETGVSLDARVSRDLLCSIFYRGSVLHDGAVIIQGDRVAAAACFLPLTTNPHLLNELGTRHRAAIGITEESDCLAIVVSEETGRVSVAAIGEIEMDVSMQRVERLLTRRPKARTTGVAAAAAAGSSKIQR